MGEKCKKCGFAENPVDALFCGMCGLRLHRSLDSKSLKVRRRGTTEIIKEILGERNTDESRNRVVRNDPCPCGSGKKYMNCHGKLRW